MVKGGLNKVLNFGAGDLGKELLRSNRSELEPCDLYVPVKMKLLKPKILHVTSAPQAVNKFCPASSEQ